MKPSSIARIEIELDKDQIADALKNLSQEDILDIIEEVDSDVLSWGNTMKLYEYFKKEKENYYKDVKNKNKNIKYHYKFRQENFEEILDDYDV